MKTPHLIGIAGGSASGKTSFLNALLEHFTPEQISLVSQDNYYRPAHEQHVDENGWKNFDLPDSIDRRSFHRDLQQLQKGNTIEREEYTFNNPSATPSMVVVEPAPVIICEGLFVFHYEEVREMLDYKVYLHADPAIRLDRRINRDHVERGYPENEVRYQWENHVRPADLRYLEPYREGCDLVVSNNEHFQEGLTSLIQHIQKQLS